MPDAFLEIEATVQAAARYVRASDDLRPRVLEAARMQRGERRAQRCIRQAGIFVILLATFTASFRSSLDSSAAVQQTGWLFAGADALFAQASAKSGQGGELAWGLVDSFTELRRRQADAFHLTP
jgi:hypothetical protein